ncbi:pyridoxal phosphate-dependent decarboxylase family protein [Thalassotalea euphylliae]|uniref:pyridoxal phosphate-dependent decarboxylase family protein n=1 Tax=Thalassotalea euphylliae TaxID=1655234 RepID=UPI00363F041C
MRYNLKTQNDILAALSRQFQHFHDNLAEKSVASSSLKAPILELPNTGMPFEQLENLIENQVQPGLSASNGGRYWGFVTGGANPVATYADWLVTTFNQNVSKDGDSMSSAIEIQAIEWLCELFHLPHAFKGIFTTGATSANFLGAVIARQFAGIQQGIDTAKQGMEGLNVSIYSATPHASMVKSLGMAGFGQRSWQAIRCEEGLESMDVSALEQALANSCSKSNIVIASAATVTGTDYDDLAAIAAICKKHDAWLHVDAAFGIFERLVNGAEGKTRGLELADSITLDCHKWLNVPYDCGVFLTRHVELLQQSFEVTAPYFSSSSDDIPFMSMGVENSRRFRAFPVWATLLSYGRDGISAEIAQNMAQAKKLASWISQSDAFELVKPCELNVVLFKPNPSVLSLGSEQCRQAINSTGKVFLTPGVWQGQSVIRAALSNWSTTDDDIETVIAVLKAVSDHKHAI